MAHASGRSQQDLVLRGGRLLSYFLPSDWEDGDATGVDHLRAAQVLWLPEIQLGGSPTVSADHANLNAQAIQAWARSQGITSQQLRLYRPRNQRPYVVVPHKYWQVVLPRLRALRQS